MHQGHGGRGVACRSHVIDLQWDQARQVGDIKQGPSSRSRSTYMVLLPVPWYPHPSHCLCSPPRCPFWTPGERAAQFPLYGRSAHQPLNRKHRRHKDNATVYALHFLTSYVVIKYGDNSTTEMIVRQIIIWINKSSVDFCLSKNLLLTLSPNKILKQMLVWNEQFPSQKTLCEVDYGGFSLLNSACVTSLSLFYDLSHSFLQTVGPEHKLLPAFEQLVSFLCLLLLQLLLQLRQALLAGLLLFLLLLLLLYNGRCGVGMLR